MTSETLSVFKENFPRINLEILKSFLKKNPTKIIPLKNLLLTIQLKTVQEFQILFLIDLFQIKCLEDRFHLGFHTVGPPMIISENFTGILYKIL